MPGKNKNSSFYGDFKNINFSERHKKVIAEIIDIYELLPFLEQKRGLSWDKAFILKVHVTIR
jgi:hypothetical protein